MVSGIVTKALLFLLLDHIFATPRSRSNQFRNQIHSVRMLPHIGWTLKPPNFTASSIIPAVLTAPSHSCVMLFMTHTASQSSAGAALPPAFSSVSWQKRNSSVYKHFSFIFIFYFHSQCKNTHIYTEGWSGLYCESVTCSCESSYPINIFISFMFWISLPSQHIHYSIWPKVRGHVTSTPT